MNNYQDLPDPCSNTAFANSTFFVEHKKRLKAQNKATQQTDADMAQENKTAAQSSS